MALVNFKEQVSLVATLPAGNINNVSYLYTFELKSAKSKTCKGAETWFTGGKLGVPVSCEQTKG